MDAMDDGYDGIRIKMGDRDREAIKALQAVTFVPGTNPKRFVAQMAALATDPKAMWTPKQYHYLWDLVYHFRKQIHDDGLIAEGEREHNSPMRYGTPEPV